LTTTTAHELLQVSVRRQKLVIEVTLSNAEKEVNGLRPIHTHTLTENQNAAGKLTAVLRFKY